ncbi:baseplate tail tube cap protein [Rhizobium phage RHph_I46]|uniref:Baseplate tail tube cap protein n=1 Tax=Rhizobium phage RHph_I1_9 TaxID=2509729 RepID=A0A7S5UXN8_9CAUD|nr:baseplate tail tube cap [Rhizobium phage RHph_I1_9]QIG69696.1 baseplate tail tube cap protein [Rhizobium phage RHph_I46]QIG70977.1 baseplate tail tube cap protein [Rhizobium phage RHph_I9]QIG73563.1 baseplate tail tube cap protein [Rhizobium phage RHph_I1_9]QIG76316.1 baseplate tail tube cap protein [Rhizobium phage RHph_I34]
MIQTTTQVKSYDFTRNDPATRLPKMQITSKKVVPTALDDIGQLYDDLSSGNLNAPRTPEAVVTLKLPNELALASEFDWSFDEKNILQSVVGSVNSNRTVDTIAEKPEAVFSGLASRIGVAASGAFGGDIVFRNAGYALAPLKEIFFNGNGNRTFNWSWDFAPRNEQESENLIEMVERLNEQSHPVMQDLGVFQIPNEFEVEWINCRLPKISTLACVSFVADLAPTGQPRFLANDAPAFVRVTATFVEIAIQTRNTLENLRSD